MRRRSPEDVRRGQAFAAFLIDFRERHGLKLRDVGAIVGRSYLTVWRWENGAVRPGGRKPANWTIPEVEVEQATRRALNAWQAARTGGQIPSVAPLKLK